MEDDNYRLITLTNLAYKELTENCIQSLINIKFSLNKIIIYAMDDQTCNYFKEKYPTIDVKLNDYINAEEQKYKKDEWNTVTMQKINIIYKELHNYEYLILFDGDIVFNKIEFKDFLIDKMVANTELDLLGQHEFKNDNSDLICSGFYIVRSNDNTKKCFDAESCMTNQKYLKNDQDYLNSVRRHLKWQHLPIHLFPNGKYYYEFHNNKEQAYIIHFNFLIGTGAKKSRMKCYCKWFL